MILHKAKKELSDLLYQACFSDISYIKKEHIDNHFFAYAIYCDSGFTSFGGAACSREGIENHINKSGDAAYKYAETFAAEWDYVNNHWECFSCFDEVNDKIIRAADDGDIDGITNIGDFTFEGLYQFYIELIIDVLNELKKQKIFTSIPFENDVLLGLQYGDPSIEERKLIIKISENVNSPEWHDKMLEAYKEWL